MITLVLEDNGDYNLKRRTVRSLEKQNRKKYCLKIYAKERRKEFIQQLPAGETDYYMFLCPGEELVPGAVEKMSAWIEKNNGDWYYGDERIKSWQGTEDNWEEKVKPDFGIFGFISYLYTGNAVIFSGRLLAKIRCEIPESEFEMFLLKMSIEAARFSNGIHIEEPLLLWRTEWEKTQEQTDILNQWLEELLDAKQLPFVVAADSESGINRLYGKRSREPECTLIVMSDDPGRNEYWRIMYEDPLGRRQVIVTDCDKSCGAIWNECAEKAKGEILFFIRAGWQVPAEFRMVELEELILASPVGTVSPRLYDRVGNTVYAGAARMGHGFCVSADYRDNDRSNYTEGVREISVPAWQFFGVRKKLWMQAGGFSEEELSADFCVVDFSLRLKKLGYTDLYCGYINAYCMEETESETQKGLLRLISNWGKALERDPFFTVSMCRKIYDRNKENTELFVPEKFWENTGKGKKILILSHELSMTGAPVVLMYAVRVLKEAGHQLLLLSPEDGILRRNMLEEQIPVLIDEDIYKNPRWLSYAKEFDLIFVNTVVPFFCIEQMRHFSVPVVWWIHDAREGYEVYLRHVLPENIGSNIDVYCVSEYARNVLHTYRPQYQAGIFMYGLPDLADELQKTYQLDCPKEKMAFLIVGTLEPRKGQDILLSAIEYMDAEDRKKCIFYFIGNKKSQSVSAKVEEAAQKQKDLIRWIPFLNRRDIFDAYAQAAAVICCSRDDPLPTFMAETMMLSGICICSENTGTAALIHSGENGYLYRNNSPKELAECITHVLKNHENMELMRRKSRETYERNFALPVFRQHLLQIVGKNLAKKRED